MDLGVWPANVDRFLRGEIAATDLEKSAQGSPVAVRLDHLCEAYFYGGIIAWIRGDKTRATVLLEQCLATKKVSFVEYVAAQAVLKWAK
jgi:lipoprotein NlpI